MYKWGIILATSHRKSRNGWSKYCNLVLLEANLGKRLASEVFRGSIFKNITLRMWRKQDSGRKIGLRFIYNKTSAMLWWVPKVRWLSEMAIRRWGETPKSLQLTVIEYVFPCRTYTFSGEEAFFSWKGLDSQEMLIHNLPSGWESKSFNPEGRELGNPSLYSPQMNILIFSHMTRRLDINSCCSFGLAI